MSPTQEESQNYQAQREQPKEGFLGKGINSVNNLVRTRNSLSGPFNKIGARLAIQATRSLATFLATNPWAWVILTMLIVVVFTFVIVMGLGGGAIPPESNPQTANPNPIPTPTETITPTPAEP